LVSVVDVDTVEADRLADRDPVDPEPVAAAVVGLDEDADREAAPCRVDDARCRPDPALELVADHPGPAADAALRDRPVHRRGQRLVHVIGRDVEAVDIIEEAVPRLADDRERPIGRAERQSPNRVTDDPVADHADRMGVRDPDRPGQEARLPDPLEAGQLAVAVQRVAAGKDRLGEDVAIVRDDHRHAGSHGSLADHERAVAPDDRGVADADPRHVRDGIDGTWPAAADDDAQIACSGQCVAPASSTERQAPLRLSVPIIAG